MTQEAAAKSRFVPSIGGSNRATNWEIRFDGGSFDLHAYELRESSNPRPTGTVEEWEVVEVSRLSLSAVSLSRLAQQIEAAKRTYFAVMGRAVPTDTEVQPKLAEQAKKLRSTLAISADKKPAGK